WGVTERAVFERARRNMAEQASAEQPAPPDMPADRGPALVRMVESGDAYWASRLLVAGWLAKQAAHVGGRPVAFVADTTGWLLTAAHGAGMARLFVLIEEEYREAARPVSPVAYTVDGDGAVVPYSVRPGDPLFPAVHRAEVVLASSEYLAQAQHVRSDAEC